MLTFSFIEQSEPGPYSPLPPHRPNGGLDTGAQATGPWGSVPVMPDHHAMSKNLLSAEGLPPNGEKQPTTFNRPGNNEVKYEYEQPYTSDGYNFYCLKDTPAGPENKKASHISGPIALPALKSPAFSDQLSPFPSGNSYLASLS